MASPADPAAQDLADLYRHAQVRLEATVRAALERDATGTAAYYAKQLAVVDRILVDLRARTPAAAAAATVRAYNAAALTVDRMLGAGRAFGGVHQQAVDVLAQAANARLVDATTTVGRRTQDAFRQAALKETALGIIEGSTIEGVADALRDRLIREAVTDATTGFIDKAGRRWPIDAYARMVARTTTREAQSAATANRMIEHDQDLVTISDHGTTSEICLPYEGETFSLTGQTAGYPTLDMLPPFHPNCEHVVTPAEVTFDAWERELLLAA